MFDLSHQVLKADICHSHSSALAEHSHATYHYLSILGGKQYLPSKQPSKALALLQDFDKGRCLRKGIMGSGIKPGKSSSHGLYLQLLILQKLLVYCCDFQLTTSRWFDMLSHFHHLIRIEV